MQSNSTVYRLAFYCFMFIGVLAVFGLLGFAIIERANDSNTSQPNSNLETSELKSSFTSNADFDTRLQRAAQAGLGEREGSIVVMDAQTGRVRAIVNSRLAAEHAFPPGSAIKPFTLLAALRMGVVSNTHTHLCAHVFRRGDFEIACSHPKSDAPFNLKQALAYSCNDCFARIGERLSESAWTRTLKSFGFGERTRANIGGESAGRFDIGQWSPRVALGEDDAMLVTPLQLATGYTALVNGGRVMRPQIAALDGFVPMQMNRIEIDTETRATLVGAMRGAIRYGTARDSKLDELPVRVFGKTGTSTASNNFRTQGWFVGFAGDELAQDGRDESLSPERVRIVVLVFLRRAHGADAAKAARPVFEEYARTLSDESANMEATNIIVNDNLVVSDMRVRRVDDDIKVGLGEKLRAAHGVEVVSISVDDYIAGVLAAESSIETEAEALRAQAVTSRTFGLANKGRHAREGFDFCTTTHCQRFVMDESKAEAKHLFRRMREVARETSRQVLIDGEGKLVDAYFHAACGGATANIERVWGFTPSPGYLNGSEDDACRSSDNQRWTTRITATDAGRVMGVDVRTNVGATVEAIEVTKRDASGRVEWLEVRGGQRGVRVRGWDFKIAVGRKLGWANLKSTRFEVEPEGNGFTFRGRGFGHGLGLCQTGAHTRAVRDEDAHAILRHYFPHTRVVKIDVQSQLKNEVKQTSQTSNANIITASFHSSERTLTSEHFRVLYTDATQSLSAGQALKILEAAYSDLMARFAGAGIGLAEQRRFDVRVYRTAGDFSGATGHAAWTGAATIDGTLHIQPFDVLRRRGTLANTLRHETLHALVVRLNPRAPRWLAEGAAIIFAGEEKFYRGVKRPRIGLAELERNLSHPHSQSETRELYAAAADAVRRRMKDNEANVWQALAAP